MCSANQHTFPSLVVLFCCVRHNSEIAANLFPPKGVPITKIVLSCCEANTAQSGYTLANSYRNYENIQVQKSIIVYTVTLKNLGGLYLSFVNR